LRLALKNSRKASQKYRSYSNWGLSMESSFKAVRRPESNSVPCNWNIAPSQDVLVIRFNPKAGLPAARAGCLKRSASREKFSRALPGVLILGACLFPERKCTPRPPRKLGSLGAIP
jgi:hypothetical protein